MQRMKLQTMFRRKKQIEDNAKIAKLKRLKESIDTEGREWC
jgi:hypothetical protein